MGIFDTIFSDTSTRFVKNSEKIIKEINALESSLKEISSGDFIVQTNTLKQKIKDGASLDSVLPEAFALVREASSRVLGIRHYDVQLIGGMALHANNIAEMRTGEGKTLMATLPAYLNALTEKGVHVVTVNDYLSRRDAVWMGPLFSLLGLSIGVVNSQNTSYVYDPSHQSHVSEETDLGSFKVQY